MSRAHADVSAGRLYDPATPAAQHPARQPGLARLAGGADDHPLRLPAVRPAGRLHRRLHDGAQGSGGSAAAGTGRSTGGPATGCARSTWAASAAVTQARLEAIAQALLAEAQQRKEGDARGQAVTRPARGRPHGGRLNRQE